ncbi:MAG: MMPL family transporter [Pseudomonadales bacterium]|nr:MMPL family transporter [Pseudomonadales bacterium]
MTNSVSISEWIYTKRIKLLSTAILGFIIAISGLYFADFESNFRSFFKNNSPLIQTYDNILDSYEQGETLALYLEFDDHVLSLEKLDIIRHVDNEVSRLPYVRYTQSLSTFQKTFSADDSIEIQYIHDWATQSDGLADIEAYIQSQQQLQGLLITDDYSGAIVLAQLNVPQPLYSNNYELLSAAQVLVNKIEEKTPGIQVHLSGTAAFDNGLLMELFHMLTISFPIIVFCVTLSVIWITRSIWITFAGLSASGLTLATTAGLFGWLPVYLDQTAVVGFILVMILTVVDCIHIGSTYIVCINESMSKEKAIKASIRANLKPIFFTTLTTSVGLITLLLTGSPPFMLFAAIALVGIFIGYFYSFIFITAILSWAPIHKKNENLTVIRIVNAVKRLVLRKPEHIVIGFIASLIVASIGISLNKIDEDISNYFMPGHELDTAIETINSNLDADNQIMLTLSSQSGEAMTQLKNFRAVERFENWLEYQDGVVHSYSLNDVIKEVRGAWEPNNNSLSLPDSGEEYSQLLLVYSMSLLTGQRTTELITDDQDKMLVTVFLENLSNRDLLQLKQKMGYWWERQPEGFNVAISGRDVIFAQLSEDTVIKALGGAAIAGILITLFMIITFRSVSWGLLSLVPNTVPFILLFGTWGFFYGEINQATCMAFTIVLGIVVDDSIHFIMKFRGAKENQTLDYAISRTFSFVGFAITGTTIAFIVNGLMLYLTTGFVPNAIIGIFMVITLIFAWLCDLLLMPALLIMYFRNKERSSPIEEQDKLGFAG